MRKGSVTRLLPYSCERLFELAADIESYPDYMPGWIDARIIERNEGQLLVRQQLGFQLFHRSFLARAELDRPRRIAVRSADGPFGDLSVEWKFEPAPGGHCRVSLEFSFVLQSAFLDRIAGRLFDQKAPLVIERFEMRARQLYAAGNRP